MPIVSRCAATQCATTECRHGKERVNLNPLDHAPMRIAIVSDIHDNLTAFQAVLVDLREAAPDLVLHGGDLVSGGSSPAEIVDSNRRRWVVR